MRSEFTECSETHHTLAAVVVTYHPDVEVLENLNALRPQVQHLIVVDNGSRAEELFPLESAARSQHFELIRNGENLGIATALNIGIRRALALNAEWIFLFDQDSRVTPGFTRDMLQAFVTSRWGERLAILAPAYENMRLGLPIVTIHVHEGIETAMTSGSLLRAETFRQHGFFRDELFIDSVDHEYSLRLRRAGLVLDEAPTAVLLHAPGTPTSHKLLRPKPFLTSNYSPARRYYQERNKIWMTRYYGRSFPRFLLKQFAVSVKDLIKILLVEEDRWRKFRYFMRGVVDGLRNRMGKLDDSSCN